jgi:hypothetical protein
MHQQWLENRGAPPTLRLRTLIALSVIASLSAAMALAVGSATRPAPVAARSLPLPTATVESPCQVIHEKVASPDAVLLGETIDITLTVRAICPREVYPLHISLVMDASGSMMGRPEAQMRSAAERLVLSLDLESHPATKVAVTQFRGDARRLAPLSNDRDRVLKAVRRVTARFSARPPVRPPRQSRPDGNTRIDLGIDHGLRSLRAGRRGLDRDSITSLMVVLSDGFNDAGCPPVLRAARKARGQGVLVLAVCTGSECDEQCMRQVASGPRYYFRAHEITPFLAVFERIGSRIVRRGPRLLEVDETLPPHMALVPGSIRPPQSAPADPELRVRWSDVYVPRDGVTYTLKVRPNRAGYLPTDVEARGRIVDVKGRGRTWTFEVPWITVLAPTPAAIPLVTPTPRPLIGPAPTVRPMPME